MVTPGGGGRRAGRVPGARESEPGGAGNAGGAAVEFAGISDTGRVRDNNEDSYCLDGLDGGADAPVLLAVADGLGGHRAGEVASSIAIRTLRQFLADGAGSWERRLRLAMEAAHAAIAQQGRLRRSEAGMATTLTAAVLDGRDLHWAHVGDSRAYLVRGGRLSRLTHDHSVAEELVAAGRIGRDAARRDPRRHLLTQALGLGVAPEVELGRARLEPGDWLILSTDGLTAVVGDEEIAAEVRRSLAPGRCCERLVALANARGGPDNITVVAAMG